MFNSGVLLLVGSLCFAETLEFVAVVIVVVSTLSKRSAQ